MCIMGIIFIIAGVVSAIVAKVSAELDTKCTLFYVCMNLFIIGTIGGVFLINKSLKLRTPEQMLEMKLKAVEDAKKDLQKFYADYPEFKNGKE